MTEIYTDGPGLGIVVPDGDKGDGTRGWTRISIDSSRIIHEVGHRHQIQLPECRDSSDSATNPEGSRLRLFENGVELRAHSLHDDIQREGLGRFSHWGETLYLSSSGNLDPRTKRYTILCETMNQSPETFGRQ